MPVKNMAKITKVDRVHVWEVIYAKLYEVFSTSLNINYRSHISPHFDVKFDFLHQIF